MKSRKARILKSVSLLALNRSLQRSISLKVYQWQAIDTYLKKNKRLDGRNHLFSEMVNRECGLRILPSDKKLLGGNDFRLLAPSRLKLGAA